MIWRIFMELSAARQWSDWGQPMPIPYSEIVAWQSVNRYRVSINDLALLRMLDAEYRSIMSEAIARRDKSSDDDDDWTN
jgi:hypothetical protein